MNYPSEICEYCRCTDYGSASVGTGPYNLCEGAGCAEAYETWQEEHPDDNSTMQDLF